MALLAFLVATAVGYEQVVGYIVGVVSLLAALGYLFRKVRRVFQWIESIHDLTTRELEHTDGPQGDSTMKDDLHGVAVALGRLQRRVDSAATSIQRNSRRLDMVEADLRSIYDPLHRSKARNDLDPPEHRREDI
jgi:hypothetical protein